MQEDDVGTTERRAASLLADAETQANRIVRSSALSPQSPKTPSQVCLCDIVSCCMLSMRYACVHPAQHGRRDWNKSFVICFYPGHVPLSQGEDICGVDVAVRCVHSWRTRARSRSGWRRRRGGPGTALTTSSCTSCARPCPPSRCQPLTRVPSQDRMHQQRPMRLLIRPSLTCACILQ